MKKNLILVFMILISQGIFSQENEVTNYEKNFQSSSTSPYYDTSERAEEGQFLFFKWQIPGPEELRFYKDVNNNLWFFF